MGYAVLHLEKAKELQQDVRTHRAHRPPQELDRTRTHLNRELVQSPEGVRNRTQAIAHRIETAGIRRKVGTNQVKAIRVLLTGSNKDMKQMEADGQLDGWCNDSLQWLRKDNRVAEPRVGSSAHGNRKDTAHTRKPKKKNRTGKRNTARRARRTCGCVQMMSWQGTKA